MILIYTSQFIWLDGVIMLINRVMLIIALHVCIHKDEESADESEEDSEEESGDETKENKKVVNHYMFYHIPHALLLYIMIYTSYNIEAYRNVPQDVIPTFTIT